MKRDLIEDLRSGTITAEEAQSIFDQWLEEGGTQPEEVGFSRHQYTAYCHGAGVEDLAGWRTQGWPKTGSICGESLVVTDFGLFGIRTRRRSGTMAER